MSVKLCINCQHMERVTVQQNGQIGRMDVCTHPDFVDPVSGSPMPPGVARREVLMCGLTGKGYKPKEEYKHQPVDPESTTTPRIIQV